MEVFEGKTRLNFAVVNVGAPCCGMNAGTAAWDRCYDF
jgi:hypothetical protein